MNEKFSEIKVRQLTDEEMSNVHQGALVYVDADFEDVERAVLVPIKVTAEDGLEAVGGFAAGETIFGEIQQIRLADPVYVEDDKGETFDVISSAGAFIRLGMFFPDMEATEVKERMFAALRKEFGSGVIQRWDEDSLPVANVLYDVYESTQVATGRGKTREVKQVRVPRATGVYGPQAKQIKPESNGVIEILPHTPNTHQAPTI